MPLHPTNTPEFWGEEVSDIRTLRRCFNLRYLEYSNINLGNFIDKNPLHLDIDNYDLYSRHWILTNDKRDILGYGRIVTGERTHFAEEIINLAEEARLQYFNPYFQFSNYTCAYENIPVELKASIKDIESTQKIAETSRLVILDKSNALRYAIFLVESAIGNALIHNDIIISSCLKAQVKLYERYGYDYLPGGENYNVKGTPFASLYLTKDMILPKHRSRILSKGLLAEEKSIARKGVKKISTLYRKVI